MAPIYAHLLHDKSDTIRIPYDQNRNHIADQWEKEMGILKKNLAANSDDDDKPTDLNKNYTGDGYTAYEEYRGFSENRKHIRTDPTTRDVMVCNTLEDKLELPYKTRAENGFSLYQGISGITVHYKFRPDEFGRKIDDNPDVALFLKYKIKIFHYDKVINFNYTDQKNHSVDQHGILITFCPDQEKNYCMAVMRNSKEHLVGTPGRAAFLFVGASIDPRPQGYVSTRGDISNNGDVSSNPNGQAKVITDYYAAAVAHEMFHCSNVNHHGSGDLINLSYTPGADSSSLVCTGNFIIDDKITMTKNVTLFINQQQIFPNDPSLKDIGFINSMLRMHLGVQNGESSGDENCIMRYSTAYLSEKNGIDASLPAVQNFRNNATTLLAQFSGTSLCTSAAGTGINAPPNSIFGDAAIGNCKSQVNINDKKQ